MIHLGIRYTIYSFWTFIRLLLITFAGNYLIHQVKSLILSVVGICRNDKNECIALQSINNSSWELAKSEVESQKKSLETDTVWKLQREHALASSDSFGRGKPTFFHPVVLIFHMNDPKGCPDWYLGAFDHI